MKKNHTAGQTKEELKAHKAPRQPVDFSNTGDRALIEFSSKILFDTYDKYATFLHLIITLAGGTTLIFFNSIKFAELSKFEHVWLALVAIGLSGLSLISAVVWRSSLQHFMEHECFGAEEILGSYFKKCGISNVKGSVL